MRLPFLDHANIMYTLHQFRQHNERFYANSYWPTAYWCVVRQ